MRAIAVWAILCAPCSAQAGAAPKQSQDARARASLERLATQTSMRFESATRNYAFEARLKAARAAGRRSVELNTFHFEGLRSGDLVAWTARPKVAKAEPETRVLVRSGAHWLMRGRDGKWLRANRPTGVWVATYLPDPVYLARSLLRVREAKWTVRGETIDDKLLRVYRLQLGAEATRRLAESGVIPYSNDVTSGIGTTTHATFARESKNSQRALEIRLIEDPKTKLPLRFEFDVFEASVTFQIVRGAGGTRALAPVIDGKKREREDLELAFSAKLTLRDFGTARIDFEDELRALLAK